MIFVTGRGKHAIEDYFDSAFEIEHDLNAKAKTRHPGGDAPDPARRPARPPSSASSRWRGLGHAVWCARHLIGDEPFAVLLPDELLWNPANPCLKQMCATYEAEGRQRRRGGRGAGGAYQPLRHRRSRRVEGAVTEVKWMVEKPKAGTAPSRLAVVGRYILQPEVLDILAEGKKGAGGEIQLTDAMAELIGKQPFHAQTFDGVRHDCGEKAGFIRPISRWRWNATTSPTRSAPTRGRSEPRPLRTACRSSCGWRAGRSS